MIDTNLTLANGIPECWRTLLLISWDDLNPAPWLPGLNIKHTIIALYIQLNHTFYLTGTLCSASPYRTFVI